MLNKADDIIVLFHKHLQGELSDAEKKELDDLLAGNENARRVFDRINSDEEFTGRLKEFYSTRNSITEEELQRVFRKTIAPAKVVQMTAPKRSYLKWMAAASVLLIAMLSYFLLFNNKETTTGPLVKTPSPSNDVAPGTYKAKLTLADGSVIILDSAALGQLAQQGNTTITNKDGQLIYDASKTGAALSGYNILATAIGESYAAVLADGSKVWLNSGSSIKYPVVFAGNERPVEITGEAFFEVAKNPKKPFRVSINNNAGKLCEVEVVGTQFNVMAYADEPRIQTTLLEGAIAITNAKDNAKKLLTPGQQATIDAAGNMNLLNEVNTDAVIAWKNQDFYFKNNDIKTVMRQLARWYGISVSYQSELPERTFSGQISRNRNLSDVMEILKKANVHFSIKESEVTILQ